jgi:YggT family protein
MQERRVERGQVVDPPADGYVEGWTEGVVDEPAGRVATSAEYQRPVAPAPAAAAVDQVHATAYDPYANRRRSSYKLIQAIWLLFGIVVGILAIRFLLKLLGANEAAGFASFIYGASAPFVAPFSNLFANPGSSGSVLELTTLVAIIVYMLVAWLVAKVIWLLAGESRSATRTVAGSTRTRLD